MVAEVVGECCQNHALMVGVVGLHRHMVFFVITFKEAELVIHPQLFETVDVLIHSTVVDADGHQRAVGRDDDAVGWGVLELQVGHTEGVVLVVLGVVELVVGCFRDAPRHAFAGVVDEGPLGTDGEAVGFVHQRVFVGGQEDERHEILEQGAVP